MPGTYSRAAYAWRACVSALFLSAGMAAAQGNGGDGYLAPLRGPGVVQRSVAFGAPVQGTLSASDPAFQDGLHFQAWRFSTRAAETVTVAVESAQFRPSIMLVSAAGDTLAALAFESARAGATVVRASTPVPAAGEYLAVVVNTEGSPGIGQYTLSLTSQAEACAPGAVCPGSTTIPVAGTPVSRIDPATARPITLDQPQQGELSRDDPRLVDRSHFDAWRFEGRAGERVVIDYGSTAFDSYLILARQVGSELEQVGSNDDAPYTQNSRLAVELPQAGTYVIVSTSLYPDSVGAYQLSLQSMARACAAGGPCQATPTGERPPLLANVAPATARQVVIGDSVSGNLRRTDQALGDGTFFHAYRFTGNAEQEVAIHLSSGQFDPFLHLTRREGDRVVPVKGDDDGGGGRNSLVTARLTRSGEYVIIVNGLTMADTGAYTLSLSTLEHACRVRGVCQIGATVAQVSLQEAIRAARSQPVASGTPTAGTFDAATPKLPDGKPFHAWRYSGRAGERVVVTNRSSDFDAFLYVFRVNAENVHEVARDDDGAGNRDAQISVELETNGDYLIVASSFAADAAGAYRLTVEPMAVACAAGGPCAPGETSAATVRLRPALQAAHAQLPPTEAVAATLPQAAPRLEGGGRFQSYRFTGTANERVLITMGSEAFDPYVHLALVRGSSLRLIASDDDGGPGTDSRLVATLPETGEYLVVASALTASDSSGFGSFTIARSACDDACAAYREASTSRSEVSYQSVAGMPRTPMPRTGAVDGVLTASDAAISGGAPFHAYWLRGTAGQTLRASLQAIQFDPYLVLLREEGDTLVRITSDDDGGEGLNALLEWPVDRTATYVVIATAYSPSAAGSYTLNVEEGAEAAREQFLANVATATARTQLAPALAAPHLPLQRGQAVTGQFGSDTPRLEGRGRFQAYRFRGRANERMVLTLQSEQFDTYLYLVQLDGRTMRLLGSDDDGGDGSNSRLVATIPRAGEYMVVAAAYSQSDSGVAHYTLKLDACDDECAAQTDAPGSRSDAAYRAVLRSPPLEIPASGTGDGSLGAADPTLGDGARFHSYSFEAIPGRTVRAALQAAAFDPYLALFRVDDDSLVRVAADDDGGEGTNALIEWPVDRGGRHVLVVTAFSQTSTGAYSMLFEQGTAETRDRFIAAARASAVRGEIGQALVGEHRPLQIGHTIAAEMAVGAPRLGARGRFHTYRFNGNANDRVVVTLESEQFDPYLYLVHVNGTTPVILGTDDDGGDGTDARLVATLPATGEYLVIATAFGGADSTAVSRYELRLAPCDDACAAAAEAGSGEASLLPTPALTSAPRRALELGVPVRGELTVTDPALADGSRFHAYSFEATAGASLRVSVEAEAFDPIVALYRTEGDSLFLVASDDDGGEGLNALLAWTVDRPGSYVLMARAVSPESTGSYTLTVSLSPATR